MKRFGFAVALCLLIGSLCACSKSSKNANAGSAANAATAPGENPNAAKTNVEELALLVNVPHEPDDLAWKEDSAHKRITAVLHFSKADADRIAANAAARQPPQAVTIASESWFPTEVIAQSEMSGDDALHGTAYAADEFFMEPYTAGRLIRIADTEYFVLQLTAK